ncbi:MAG: methyltransferase domain-containing protein [Pseudonocardiaceae bacterium]|nr:methyltransferase domain-containing protein [Pseudonocardiaceae bacterium]
MTDVLNRLLDTAFGHPKGLLGRIGGRLMARGNAETEHQLVRLAKLGERDTVLAVGPGPGIGLRAAAERAGAVIGVDPSETMLAAAREQCRDYVDAGLVELRLGTAESTGLTAASVDVVLSVNNVQIWTDRAAGLAELFRVLRPGGRLLISAHERWLPVTKEVLADEARAAGFTGVQAWAWEPGGRTPVAAQLSAERPPRPDESRASAREPADPNEHADGNEHADRR